MMNFIRLPLGGWGTATHASVWLAPTAIQSFSLTLTQPTTDVGVKPCISAETSGDHPPLLSLPSLTVSLVVSYSMTLLLESSTARKMQVTASSKSWRASSTATPMVSSTGTSRCVHRPREMFIARKVDPTRPEDGFLAHSCKGERNDLPRRVFCSKAQKQPCCLAHLPLSRPFCWHRGIAGNNITIK